MRTNKKMPTPLGIGAGQTASVQLPLGLTYHMFNIRMNIDDGGTPTDVPADDWGLYLEEIRLIVNGDTRIQIDADDLVKLNKFYGIELTAGVLPLFLSRPWMRTPGGEDQTSYGTAGGMASFALEMDIADGVTVNSLNVYAKQSAGTPFGPHLRVQKFVHNQGVTGEAEIADIPRGAYALGALHITTDQIGKSEVMVDNRKVMDGDKATREANSRYSKRVPQAGLTHIDFTEENRISETLPMAVSDFRLKLDFATTGNFSIYAESIRGA
ncbi:major capsid protein P2 [Celeribacter baekdonensis]|uniref:major capsid protein P2 n=1 Tax=Pseudomonadota TaxID=1224 RepID=UPI003A8F3FD5